jgi:rhodanese-related sulfurtransferase
MQAVSSVSPTTSREISREELLAVLHSGTEIVLAEVLPRAHWAAGHLPRALNFPLDAIVRCAAENAPDKSALVVLYCASITCQNSHIAARSLVALGYGNVRVYAGGKADWKSAGLPLVGEA